MYVYINEIYRHIVEGIVYMYKYNISCIWTTLTNVGWLVETQTCEETCIKYM